MMKLSRLPATRNELAKKLLPAGLGNVNGFTWLSNYTSRVGISTYTPDTMRNGNNSGRAYAPFAIFKGKAALMVSPVLPTLSKTDSGFLRVDRSGVVLLKFMPASGQRKYDSDKKQFFALSATEVGSLISLGPSESCEFFHDPSMKSSLEGQVRKTLAVLPLNDSSGHFFNLSVVNSAQKTNERFSVPVSKAEFAVMRSAFSFALPHILGWNFALRSDPEGAKIDRPKQQQLNMDPDSEWGR